MKSAKDSSYEDDGGVAKRAAAIFAIYLWSQGKERESERK